MCKTNTIKLCVVIGQITENLKNPTPDEEAPKPSIQDNSKVIHPVTTMEINEIGH